MDCLELCTPDGKSAGVFACARCKLIWTPAHSPLASGGRQWTEEERAAHARQRAVKCCEEAKCDCGAGLGHTNNRGGRTTCNDCKRKRQLQVEQERFDKAVKLTPEEWGKSEFAGAMVYDELHDRWFAGVAEAEEWNAERDEDDTPTTYLYCSEPVRFEPDLVGYVKFGV